VAQELSNRLRNRFQVNSILCMDGTSAVVNTFGFSKV
jgi:hypothetical protein